VKQFRTAMENELAQVVFALAKQFNFDADEGIKFLKSGSKTRKSPAKKAKMTPEQKVARELAKAAIKKARQNERDEKKAAKLAEREKVKAAKLAEREKVKAAKLAEKEAAKAAKLAEKEAAKAAKLAEKEAAKAAKLAEKAVRKEEKLCEKLLKKALTIYAGPDAEWGTLGDKDADFIAETEGMNSAQLTSFIAKLKEDKKSSAKEAKSVAKLTAQLAKLFDLEELDDDLKQTVAGKDSAGLKALIAAEKEGLKAEKKKAKLIAEIRDLAKHVGGGINFSENEIENADMDGLKEIRKTIKKCLRKIERAERVAAVKDQLRVDNAKFAGQMGNICC
jgi:histone H1/5